MSAELRRVFIRLRKSIGVRRLVFGVIRWSLEAVELQTCPN